LSTPPRYEAAALVAAASHLFVYGGPPPRLPGERALRLCAEQLRDGVALHPAIPPVLAARCAAAGFAAPSPIDR
jgi:hypothetical protein